MIILAIPLLYLAYRSFVKDVIGAKLTAICNEANAGLITTEELIKREKTWRYLHWLSFILLLSGSVFSIIIFLANA
jgi:hypothetical protein